MFGVAPAMRNRDTKYARLCERIESWSGARTVTEVVAIIEAADVPVTPIWNIELALHSPQALARQILQPVNDPALPGLELPTQPVRFARRCAEPARARSPTW